MTAHRSGRLIFGVAFTVLVLDGAGAIWLGQLTDRWLLVAVGLGLVAGATGLVPLYRRWRAALDEIDRARRELQEEIRALRRAMGDARAGRDPLG